MLFMNMYHSQILPNELNAIQGVFKKRPNFCYKDFIAHFTAF